jgi:pimeloyl-ACP methyl ester carboxylesterase
MIVGMNLRKYGNPPYRVAVVHGGPGARGEVAPVAKELAKICGVLEPLQSALTIDGEIEELRQQLAQNTDAPVALIGYSWGAWLGFLLAARYPLLVSRLILVSSGPFTQEYARNINRTRFNRLCFDERERLQMLKAELDNPVYSGDRDSLMSQIGALMGKADAFDPLPHEDEGVGEGSGDIFAAIWPEAAAMRSSGELLVQALKIQCPVVAIHGDYDPHPADGVRIPLSGVLKDFKFILLEKCGHTPWLERQARDSFYEALKKELG